MENATRKLTALKTILENFALDAVAKNKPRGTIRAIFMKIIFGNRFFTSPEDLYLGILGQFLNL